jgi:hypothetical protein
MKREILSLSGTFGILPDHQQETQLHRWPRSPTAISHKKWITKWGTGYIAKGYVTTVSWGNLGESLIYVAGRSSWAEEEKSIRKQKSWESWYTRTPDDHHGRIDRSTTRREELAAVIGGWLPDVIVPLSLSASKPCTPWKQIQGFAQV